jgi:CBS domain
VRTATPAAEVHRLFLSLSLRHLPVVDRHGIVWGMITRKDLDRAAGRGWWRCAGCFGPVSSSIEMGCWGRDTRARCLGWRIGLAAGVGVSCAAHQLPQRHTHTTTTTTTPTHTRARALPR